MSERLAPVAGDEAALMRRYVGSLYALAEKDKAVDAVAADMDGLRRLWDESAEWRAIACDPRLENETVIKAVDQVASMAGLSKLTGQFLSVVAQNRRLNLLPAFIQGFCDEVATRRGEYRADVRVARALTTAQKDALAASLNAAAGGKVHVNLVEDGSLLGGLTVKLGTTFIDASVKSRLDHLERTLKAGAVA